MEELQQKEMWAIYLMAQGKEMTDAVTKVDLTRIILILCKKLSWIEEHQDCKNNPMTTSNNKKNEKQFDLNFSRKVMSII